MMPDATPCSRRVVLAALVWAAAVAVPSAIVNTPCLRPEQFWSSIHPDQAMMIGFMEKNHGMSDFSRDFVFNADPNLPKLYNPLNASMVYWMQRLVGGNLPLAFLL